jgi:hypothetical protein
MRRVAGVAAVLCVAAVLLTPTTASADAPWGKVNCDYTPSAPQCTITVVDQDSRVSRGGGGGPLACKFAGKVVDCYNGFGWLGAGGCYYGKDPGGFLPPHEWIKRCIDPATGDVHDMGVVLLLNPPAMLAALLRQAVSRLRIPQPVIAANPALDAPQVVQVPVWWWVQPGSWSTRTATAALPAIAITATATPEKITWDAGDGTTTVCTGPGTPWTPKYAPTAASPTCGHTYTRTSRTAPGGKFTLRAAITWTVTWAGGGMSGTEPATTTSAAAEIEVTELRAVITG